MPRNETAQQQVELVYRGPDDEYHTAGRERSFVRDGAAVPVGAEEAERLMALRYTSPLHRFEVRAAREEPAAGGEPAVSNPPVPDDPFAASGEMHTLATIREQERAQADVVAEETARKSGRGK